MLSRSLLEFGCALWWTPDIVRPILCSYDLVPLVPSLASGTPYSIFVNFSCVVFLCIHCSLSFCSDISFDENRS